MTPLDAALVDFDRAVSRAEQIAATSLASLENARAARADLMAADGRMERKKEKTDAY